MLVSTSATCCAVRGEKGAWDSRHARLGHNGAPVSWTYNHIIMARIRDNLCLSGTVSNAHFDILTLFTR